MSLFSKVLSTNNLFRWTKLPVIAPFYHLVSDIEPDHIWPLYNTVTVSDFEHQIQEMAKAFSFITADELNLLVAGEDLKKSKPPMFLSFDDGLKECYDVIFPILKKEGIPATFFVNPSFIETEDIFYRYKVSLILTQLQKTNVDNGFSTVIQELFRERGKLKYTFEQSLLSLDYSDIDIVNKLIRYFDINITNRDIYMSKIEIKELKNEGFNIGGHSMDHPNFSTLSLVDQVDQIDRSLNFIQQNFDEKWRLFAFPFYDFDLGKTLYNKMYSDLKVDLSFGTSGVKKDQFKRSVQRLPMEEEFDNVISHIKNQMIRYVAKKMVGRHLIHRKA